jgi:hypothetical protein
VAGIARHFAGRERKRHETNHRSAGARARIWRVTGTFAVRRETYVDRQLGCGGQSFAHLQCLSGRDLPGTFHQDQRRPGHRHVVCGHQRRDRSRVLLPGNGRSLQCRERALEPGSRGGASAKRSSGRLRTSRPGYWLDSMPRFATKASGPAIPATVAPAGLSQPRLPKKQVKSASNRNCLTRLTVEIPVEKRPQPGARTRASYFRMSVQPAISFSGTHYKQSR